MENEGGITTIQEEPEEIPDTNKTNGDAADGDTILVNKEEVPMEGVVNAIPFTCFESFLSEDPSKITLFNDESDAAPISKNVKKSGSAAACNICKYCNIIGEAFLHNHAHEPWPSDVRLFQPYEVEQILLPDNANCLAVQTFLKMCNLGYQMDFRSNAEAMSPTGKVPFIKCGAFIVAELEGIVQFVGSKGISLTQDLAPEDKSDMRAYMALVNNVLGNAELYICWCDTETYTEVTKPRYGSIHPWPLNHIQTWTKRNEEVRRLTVLGWQQKTLEEVYNDVETCCQALTDRLDGNEFFFGAKPTELEALIFGHLYTILTTPLPNATLANTVKNFPDLINLITRIERHYFQRETQH